MYDSYVGYDTDLSIQRYHYLNKRIRKGLKGIVVTCAQNNTRINKPQFETLLNYCKHNNYELVVIPLYYKTWTGKHLCYSWSEELWPYIIDRSLYFNNLVVHAELRIPATSLNPLTGKQPISGTCWTVFGHPQFAMQTVPSYDWPKRMYTTGAVTIRNYTKTDYGARAKFHHVQGALVIERDKNKNFVRQLNSEPGGNFYDLDKYYTPDKILKNQSIEAIVTGDEHVRIISNNVKKAIYTSRNSLVKRLRPKYIVRHDVLDGYAGSHHHENNDVLGFRKFHTNENSYKKELDDVVNFLNETTPKGAVNLIVWSNHHEHLTKWLAKVDPKKDHVNAILIHELKLLQYKAVLNNKHKQYDEYDVEPFRMYVQPKLKCKANFLHPSKKFLIRGVDVAQHGHIGVNGARGNARSYANTTFKMVVMHSHVSCICKGVYQGGKGTENAEYEKGLSSHTQTEVLIYKNGKRTLIDILDGQYCR